MLHSHNDLEETQQGCDVGMAAFELPEAPKQAIARFRELEAGRSSRNGTADMVRCRLQQWTVFIRDATSGAQRRMLMVVVHIVAA